MSDKTPDNPYPIILYQTDDGETKIDVRFEGETVWLTQDQMAELFERDKSTISKHVKNVINEGELSKESVVAKFAITASDGKKYQVEHYNLDMIISVGYRVNSIRGTQFRIWATRQLREFIVKGFVVDDERMKHGSNYFKELEERVRQIRLSERNLYQKVRDLFALSSDYFPQSDQAKRFFAVMQNKFEYAITEQTAPELIKSRIDANKDNCGLTTWKGTDVTVQDAKVAKNYMVELELKQLGLLVEAFLALAELHVSRNQPVTMRDWGDKLNNFLASNTLGVLDNAGSVSREEADKLASEKIGQYRQKQQNKQLPKP